MSATNEETILRIARFLQQCGTCDHQHDAGLTCPTCGCAFFVLHETAQNAIDDLALKELIEFGPDAELILDSTDALNLATLLETVEGSITTWDNVPGLGVITATEVVHEEGPEPDSHIVEGMLVVRLFDLGRDDWLQFPNALDLVAQYAQRANDDPQWLDQMRQEVEVDPDDLILAWVFIAEAYAVLLDGSMPQIRTLVCVDCDGRVYMLIRRQDSNTRTAVLQSVQSFTRSAEAAVAEAKAAGESPPDKPTSQLVVEVLSRLCRATTQDTALRRAMEEAQDG